MSNLNYRNFLITTVIMSSVALLMSVEACQTETSASQDSTMVDSSSIKGDTAVIDTVLAGDTTMVDSVFMKK